MKQTLTALMVLSLLLSGCQKEEEEPEKIKVIQVVKKIEVNKKYDPLTFIRDTNGNGYFISVAQDDINNTQLGTYSITFLVETGDRERSEEITYQIEVADTTRPQITCSGSISIEKGKEFVLEEYATATDNYDGDITREITVEGELDTNTAGTYPLVLSVTDSSGNEDKKNITIYVEESD
ncbi:MAG: DUF5011 domain-containing protein, partial [Erysipelotrichaceae bacterium]|nr:DUF5011 domain-containing protein [Erysipelotrichaceae bacterium]